MKNGKGKLVLVAGGAGFLGSHLCDALLSEGAHVIALDNLQTGRKQNLRHLEREPRFDFIDSDVIKPLPARLRTKRMKIDEIFNLACAASPPHYQANPEHTMLTSVVGTHNLLSLAETTGSRFFLASTSEIYGDPEVHPQPESYWGNVNPTGPRACYDEGKRAAETLTFDFERSGRVDIRVARIFNTYGPRMRSDDGRVVSNVICQALAGDDITIYGDGSQTRSFCYVSDLVDGFLRLMAYEGKLPGAVNLGNPVELTVGDLANRVLAMTGSSSRVVRHPLPTDDPRRRRPDISRARQLLGWNPATPLEAGLHTTIAWFAGEQENVDKASRMPAVVTGAVPVS
ncbi:UDP-glucuronic acid decarboxylase family protein [Microvirga subterranea]|uniref:UDP-glucuronate decarboxylase n=1 Tax=Microvirga subterranea TaxID=186651 RepID=A0A370HLV7_9HYPH|nr:UDP-glucuronic acid decarboxylase family protein [Microvirga subterranea]RDI59320.1 UDP-glucuronate decarboxylase [Microvirga subterranea]